MRGSMRGWGVLVGVGAACSAWAGTREAQHQGRLLDVAGNPLNGSFALTVSLYRSPTGTSSHFTDTFAAVPVQDGYFSVTLGAASGNPLEDVDLDGAVWIGVSVGATELTREAVVPGVAPFRAPAPTTLSACDADTRGAIVLHPTTGGFVGCNGSSWVELGGGNDGSSSTSPGQSCQQLQDDGYATLDGAYWIAPAGLPVEVWCEVGLDGGGWTKVMYFSSPRALTTSSVNATTMGQTFGGVGKLRDVDINALMTGTREMLAVYPSDPAKWTTVTWGSSWVFQDTRPSGQLGGFCQDTGGGAIRRYDGTSGTATYRDAVNAASSYCWLGSFPGGGSGGIDLQNDGVGESNAITQGSAQVPFVLFVR
jgi:hypothetical protein